MLSVVILAKNEEQNIERCLRSLSWADELVVVDDGSADKTIQLAEANGARVLQHQFESFAKQRNWALEHGNLRNEWVLMLDADETGTKEFGEAVSDAIGTASTDVVAFRTCRKTMLDEAWLKYSDGFPVWIMRLVRRGQASFQDSGHGEVPVPDVEGQIGTIKEPFVHYPFSRGIDDWYRRHEGYARREATKEIEQSTNVSLGGLISRERSKRRAAFRQLSRSLPARGSLRFAYQYFFKLGFLDGKAGFRFCRMMASYESSIVRKKRELRRS